MADFKVPNYTTMNLANDMGGVPHSMAVKKVKKYSGHNKNSKGGAIYGSNKKRLSIIPLGRADVNGKKETIYQFNKEAYEVCVEDEARFYEENRARGKSRGVEASKDNSYGLGWYQSLTKSQAEKYSSLDDIGKEEYKKKSKTHRDYEG
jgi:hypothetical protein|tara:strand:- start:1328 stop:1774 length:447 start_codon:yes stop_codon:yes gene_type:complete